MRTLVVTTGTRDYIMNVYLPTIKNKGEYNGDILLVDYKNLKHHFEEKDIIVLKKDYNIIYRQVESVYSCIPSDRIRAFYECLRENDLYKQYDVIMVTDGNDIEYFKSILPLFELAKDIFSYVIETPEHLLKSWIRFKEYPDADKIWEVIKYKSMINAGMLIGPSKNIMEVLEFITNSTKYNSKFGADQMLLNAMVYYYNYPSQAIGYEWNYVLLTGHRRMVTPIKGKVYASEDNREIAILHRNGAGHMDYALWRKLIFPACQLPNEGWMNRIDRKRVDNIINTTREKCGGVKDEKGRMRGGIWHTTSELYLMNYLLNKVSNVEGDMAEVGVSHGGSAMYIAEFKGNKKLYLFDTFEGFPDTDKDDFILPHGKQLISRHLEKGVDAAPLEEVKERLKGYNDVYFYKGIFPQTSGPIKNTKFSFVNLDVDTYLSTINGLNFFYSRVNNNGVILIHDYAIGTGVKKALDEFLVNKPETLMVEGNQCYLIKNEIINVKISDIVIYPYFNERIHNEVNPLYWYKHEYVKSDDSRNSMEYIKNLGIDIKSNGMKNPLVVEKLSDGKYGVIDGNHRFYASLLEHIQILPCRIISLEEKTEILSRIQNIGFLRNAFSRFKWFYITYPDLKPDNNILNIGNYYDIKDKRVLELGTFEGRDTYALEYMNPREIVTVEGRIGNYMKANLFKFAFKMDKTILMFKDIEKLDFKVLDNFDIVIARGILHYMVDPVRIIKEISTITNNLWLGIRLVSNDCSRGELIEYEGYKARKFTRNKESVFQGLYEYGVWLYKDELIRLLKELGYSITIVKEPDVYDSKNNYAEIYANK